MLTKLEIENFKSIRKESIDLGRVNVFIGENGCGKTNILETLGMLSASKSNKLGNDELALKGIRVTKPSITFNSFKQDIQKKEIRLGSKFQEVPREKSIIFYTNLRNEEPNQINSEWKSKDWVNSDGKDFALNKEKNKLLELVESAEIIFQDPNFNESGDFRKIIKKLSSDLEFLKENFKLKEQDFDNIFTNSGVKDYKIYNLSTQILRGIGGRSLEIPGINGENLDILINSFSKEEMEELEQHASMISWLDKIIIDKEDALKLEGHKLNLSQSKLYFRDKFMQKKNNVFSAENANEGILHALFYIALFISKKTPKLFAIDNIETALNPYLGRVLIEKLIKLAKKYDKQVL